ncbi:MAG: Triosephosphate isomerase [Candidatus Roizmanbacteria bacterium GW2011_GWA2_36_23]|uniref:Triosephosphate isomerase n=1 Tax=Candidatus Roizmanbacteria bacterium GW2011_GWA2_36_23 TaxID=1618480 RepID=A0A0G0E5J5_9BACT|nr:MAG: Triosephosphate isomerase [Candidatus Roizmanbacteria bacterium GW2011_GWA2_36_23]
MKYFIANWKACMTQSQAQSWMHVFLKSILNDSNLQQKLQTNQIKIIICPPYPILALIRPLIKNIINVELGSQDLSMMNEGSYTGECTAKMLKDYATFAIIGHSERRKYFLETDEIIAKKINQAKLQGLEPVVCIRNEVDSYPPDVSILAYEPVYAIGTGQNEPVQKVVDFKNKLRLTNQAHFLYGGSVDPDNAKLYLESDSINGFLIGTSSLNPQIFYSIVKLG